MNAFGMVSKEVIEFLPMVLPTDWQCVRTLEDGAHFVQPLTGLSVIVSMDIEQDGKRWLHVSTATPDCLPSWDQLCVVKDMFIGKDRIAFQVLPKKKDHVNIHNFCLHLWSCMDGNHLPDFTRGGDSI